jgi:hypothetical protein
MADEAKVTVSAVAAAMRKRDMDTKGLLDALVFRSALATARDEVKTVTRRKLDAPLNAR